MTSRLRLALTVAAVAACRGGDAIERPDIDATLVEPPVDAMPADSVETLVDAPPDEAFDAAVDGTGTDAAIDAAIDATTIDAGPLGGFRTVGSLAHARAWHAVALLTDGRVLVVGGYAPGTGSTWTASAEVFNPATDMFSPVGSTAFFHQYPQATTLADGRVLVTGRVQTASGLAPKTEIFDPATNTFSPGPDMLDADSSSLPTRLADGRVLFTGESNEIYDPSTNRFLPMPPLNVLGPGHEAVRLASNRVLLSGGPHQGSSGGGTREDAEEFDPATGNFSMTGSMATARAAHELTPLPGGRALASGGYIGLGGEVEVYASAEIYDPTTRTFASAGLMTTSRHGHRAESLADGRVLIVGGVSDGVGTAPDNDFETVASAEIYNAAARTFTPTPPMHTPRVGHTATRLHDGRVLIVGGSSTNGGPPTAAAEVYEP